MLDVKLMHKMISLCVRHRCIQTEKILVLLVNTKNTVFVISS